MPGQANGPDLEVSYVVSLVALPIFCPLVPVYNSSSKLFVLGKY
jgi:hypothetical protein